MKIWLYIILYSFLNTVHSGFDNVYDLFLEYQDYFKLEYTALELNEKSLNALSGTDFSFSDRTIATPFALKLEFRLDVFQPEPPCIFSFEGEKDIVLGVCIPLIGPDVVAIDLKSKHFHDSMQFTEAVVKKNEWKKVLFYVENDKITLYDECLKITSVELPTTLESILLPSDYTFYIGKSVIEKSQPYEGAVREIKIFYNVTNINVICEPEEDFKFPDSSEMEEEYDFTQGSPGEKGQKGDIGPKGDKGDFVQGPVGLPGSPGPRGEAGECACSESVVSSLLKTMPEMRGPAGEPGPKGEPGISGPMGLTGKPGDKGERGAKGDQGDKGIDGTPGRDGVDGKKGEPGTVGLPGLQGIQGKEGRPGPPGPSAMVVNGEMPVPGPKGEPGPIGLQGPPGIQGIHGDNGGKGYKGEKGQKGEQGNTGAQGPRGEKGSRGDSGLDGKPGIPGDRGKLGKEGKKGDIGSPGIPAKLSSLLDPEMDSVKKKEIVDLLKGEKGDQGLIGPKGEVGEPGVAGKHGLNGRIGKPGNDGVDGKNGTKGEKGSTGEKGHKGDQGEIGPPGLPVNIDLANLKGLEGRIGSPGVPGPRGMTGEKGDIGIGSIGPRGHTGHKGPMGPVGPPGVKGPQGQKGEKGESALPAHLTEIKGDKGDKGDTGSPGKPGTPGLPGSNSSCSVAQSVHGSPGPPGLPGPPGPPGLSITGPKGEPGGIVSQQTFLKFTHDDHNKDGANIADDDDDPVSVMTVIYKTTVALFKRTSSIREGTLAYVLQEKILLLRVDRGWQHVSMGHLIDVTDSNMLLPTTLPFTTTTSTNRPVEETHVTPPPRYDHESITRGKYMVSTIEPSSTTATRAQTSIRIAALNQPYPGNMLSKTSGWNVANNKCHRQALNAKVGGTFKAFLASDIQSLPYIVDPRHRRLPVLNLRGELLFHSWESMFDGSGAYLAVPNAHIYSFDWKNVMNDYNWPERLIWHGANSNGNVNPESSCNQWSSDNANDFGFASSLWKHKLLDQERVSCHRKLIVMCVEVKSTRSHPVLRKRHNDSKYRRQRHPSLQTSSNVNQIPGL